MLRPLEQRLGRRLLDHPPGVHYRHLVRDLGDDALYVAVRLLDILARGTATVADLKDAMPVAYNTPDVRFNYPEERKFAAIAEVRANLAKEGAEVNDIDGVRVERPTAGGGAGVEHAGSAGGAGGSRLAGGAGAPEGRGEGPA